MHGEAQTTETSGKGGAQMGTLWQKDYQLDALIERFTVGEDWRLDNELLAADCLSSIAHARTLLRAGLLGSEEEAALERELKNLIGEAEKGEFAVSPDHEDGHTAIENELTARLGETGGRIHTGRSRNDQVLTALRVYARDAVHALLETGLGSVRALLACARRWEHAPMPGRTHMQIAMPSSVGLWSAAYAEELLDGLRHLRAAGDHTDQCPLGSAASYGVPLPLDRAYSAELLGFRRVQRNVLYAGNTRGKFEGILVDAAEQLMLTLSTLAQDLIIFSLPEFGYVTLPKELCSGSSIMPQKRNPDALELLRAKASSVSAFGQQIRGVIRSLPSGYNRDLQETKEPFLRAMRTVRESLAVAQRTVERIEFHPDRLAAAFPREIFATDAAYEKVRGGMSFREAYREVGLDLESVPERPPEESIAERTGIGMTGNLGLADLEGEIDAFAGDLQHRIEENGRTMEALAGRAIRPADLRRAAI
jgi:argininosuccinate lyase